MAATDQASPNEGQANQYDTDSFWTVPNMLSLLRLAGVPVFLWLLLGPHNDLGALIVIILAGISDLLDGKIARRFHQVSRAGQMLDPAADRLYILSTIIALAIRDFIPWWLVVLLIGRDLVLAGCVPFLRRRGYTSLPVHYAGKVATFFLMYAFPLVLLGGVPGTLGQLARIVGWAFAIWGTLLYWYAGGLYVRQTIELVRDCPPGDGGTT